MAKTVDRLLPTREAAEFLNLRPETLVAWRVRQTPNRPQPVRVGSRLVRYREADLIAWRDRETAVRDYHATTSTKRRGK